MQNSQNTIEMTNAILAIDIGGTFIKSGLLDKIGICHDLAPKAVCSDGSCEQIIADIASVIRNAWSYCANIEGIGVSIPGPFDYAQGISLMTHKFATIHGINLIDALRKEIPETAGIPIKFKHDANSFLLGEIRGGAGTGFARVGGITLGTGIGAAFCIDGSPLVNKMGSPSVEVSIWNKPYKEGIVEDYISGHALTDKYSKTNSSFDSSTGVKPIATLAQKGDSEAIRIFIEFGTEIGQVLLPWIEKHRPQVIVFGGQISKAFLFFECSLQDAVQKSKNPPELRLSRLGTSAALYGASLI